MANPTSNFGWQMPTNTDLVKDLPADFEVFGQAVDTSLMDLKGGTTGQVLSKASNTDMDFTWVAQDDSNAIQNAIVDAKGDLITATAADTPARLAVGTNGQYLIADSTTATGLKWGDVSAGSMTLITSGTASGNTISLTSIPQTYRDLRIEVVSARNTTSGGRQYNIRINNNSSSIYYNADTTATTWTLSTSNNGNSSFFDFGYTNTTADNDCYTQVTFFNYTNTAINKSGSYIKVDNNATNVMRAGNCFALDLNAITSIQLIMQDSENWAGGTYYLYGVK
jgi:hypothetical protein